MIAPAAAFDLAALPPALRDPRVPWSARQRWIERTALAAQAAAVDAPPQHTGGRPRAECGTPGARDRHRRKHETCATCRMHEGRAVRQPRAPRATPKDPPPTPDSGRRRRRDVSPCRTRAARRRHRRYGELCDVCGVDALGPGSSAPLAPCGTQSAKRRHRKKGEKCATCAGKRKRIDRAPCGTKDARARHRRNGETWCDACGGPTLRRPASAKPRKPRPTTTGDTA